MNHTVFVVSDTLRAAKYEANRFVEKYCHRIIQVKNRGLEFRLKYDEENTADVYFLTFLTYQEYKINKLNGGRFARYVDSSKIDQINFNSLDDILRLLVCR